MLARAVPLGASALVGLGRPARPPGVSRVLPRASRASLRERGLLAAWGGACAGAAGLAPDRRRARLPRRALADRGEVRVAVERRLAAAPVEAYDAWLQFVWRQGGGLGALCLADGAAEGEARTMYPVGMREELMRLQRGRRVEYRVTDFGLFLGLSDHRGMVDFVPDGDASKLTWSVRFSSPRPMCSFWEAVANFLVGAAAANLEEVLKQERVCITAEETLDGAPLESLAAFERFTWRSGGGPPFLPPQILREGEKSGEGLTRVVLPPGLQERFTRVGRSARSCSVEYVVDNPGLLTLYPVAAHTGRVQFDAAGSGTRLVWTVEALPLPGCARFVETFTRLVVATLAANLRRELQQ